MGLSDELQDGIGSLWERVVTHPFIIELGDGTLPQEIFAVYFETGLPVCEGIGHFA